MVEKHKLPSCHKSRSQGFASLTLSDRKRNTEVGLITCASSVFSRTCISLSVIVRGNNFRGSLDSAGVNSLFKDREINERSHGPYILSERSYPAP